MLNKKESRKNSSMAYRNQFELFTQKRFLPYFSTQFLGAFNDNLFKTALLILISMSFAREQPDKANVLNNLGAAAFIFPFFIFSATAGQLADKYQKPFLIRVIKFAEIIIALFIAVGLYYNHIGFLIAVLCLLGTQSAFFSPVKYSILPQYLDRDELMGGNGLVEMGTFVAILTGTIVGGLLMSHPHRGGELIALATFLCAMIGWLCSLFIPCAQYLNQTPTLKINWNPFTQTFNTLKEAYQHKKLFWTMISISWFWFFGSIILTQIPNYTKLYIGGSAIVMTIMLTTASLGIGIGSMLCELLCRRKIEMGLVPFGSIGITIFTADLSWVVTSTTSQEIGAAVFLQHWQNYRILIDLFCIGLFGGFYSVPLYVILQTDSKAHNRSQIIAGNNILNALFMTFASALAIFVLKQLQMSIPQLFFLISILNALFAVMIYTLIPEFWLRFKIWLNSWLRS